MRAAAINMGRPAHPEADVGQPAGQGLVTQFSVQELPLNAGLAVIFLRQFPDQPPRQEGWPLRGALWEMGAGRLREGWPDVTDASLLLASLAMAGCKVDARSCRQ